MDLELDSLSLTEIIRLQDQLSATLRRRFERPLALAFSDIVGSTAYCSRFGNEAGRRLDQRHIDLLMNLFSTFEGRMVNTAGDGVFLCFPVLDQAAAAMMQVQQILLQENSVRPLEEHLVTRIGLHWGTVLTDGEVVTGDAVNTCARIAGSAQAGEIRLTNVGFGELSKQNRLRCRPLGAISLKGIEESVDLFVMDWRDPSLFPNMVRIEETGETFTIPDQARITFGRLKEHNGVSANDIVLGLSDSLLTQKISRWHFELQRKPEGLVLYLSSSQVTQVDGLKVEKGSSVPIHHGSVVSLSGVMTLSFLNDRPPVSQSDDTSSTTLQTFHPK